MSIGGRLSSNLRFADDIDLMSRRNSELQALTEKLAASANSYGMEINSDRSKGIVDREKLRSL